MLYIPFEHYGVDDHQNDTNELHLTARSLSLSLSRLNFIGYLEYKLAMSKCEQALQKSTILIE